MGRFENCEWYPVVAIPARNEAERLPRLFEALSGQSWLDKSGRRLDIVLVLNGCSDASARVATRCMARYPKLSIHLFEINFAVAEAHVGSARRFAMERALQMCRHSSRSVLLTTDADAAPTQHWIDANLRALNAGAAIVGGHILGDEAEEALLGPRFLRRAARQLQYAKLIDHLAALIDPLPYDPWPRHSDHTGASLAVRANVYAAVGGIPALPFREDLALVSRVRGAGYRLRHPLDVRVRVSARLDGRAPGGMADCIKAWLKAEEDGLPHLVEDPMSTSARLRKRRQYRAMSLERPVVTKRSSHSNSALSPRAAANLLTIPALIEVVAPDEPDASPGIPVEAAIHQIKQMIADAQSEARVA